MHITYTYYLNNTHLLHEQLVNITFTLHLGTHPPHKNSQPRSKWTFHPKHIPHPRHNLHSRLNLYPKYRTLFKPRPYLKNKIPPQSKHPLLHNTHSKYDSYSTSTMASAYRPRHTHNYPYYRITNWKPNSITNPNSINIIKSHFLPQQIENIIHAIPNLFTTTKFIITIYLKINMKKPKTHHSYGYYFINKLELLKCGDIELNPGPMPNILHTHPATHKKRARTYFIPNTIKF